MRGVDLDAAGTAQPEAVEVEDQRLEAAAVELERGDWGARALWAGQGKQHRRKACPGLPRCG